MVLEIGGEDMPDMLVKLFDMPKIDLDDRMEKEGIVIKRAMA